MKAQENKSAKKAPKKFKIRYIILSVLCSIILAIGFVAAANFSYIKAAYNGITTSETKIKEKQQLNNEKTKALVEELTESEIRDLPEDMRKKLETGEISETDAKNYILGRDDQVSVQEQNGETTGNSNGEGNGNYSASEKKNDIIAQIYILRARYLSRIDGLISSGKSAVKSIPPGQRTISELMRVVNGIKAQGEALEGQCDAEMEALLGELKTVLEQSGEDTSIISEIRASYNEQKELKKSELVNMYASKI